MSNKENIVGYDELKDFLDNKKSWDEVKINIRIVVNNLNERIKKLEDLTEADAYKYKTEIKLVKTNKEKNGCD